MNSFFYGRKKGKRSLTEYLFLMSDVQCPSKNFFNYGFIICQSLHSKGRLSILFSKISSKIHQVSLSTLQMSNVKNLPNVKKHLWTQWMRVSCIPFVMQRVSISKEPKKPNKKGRVEETQERIYPKPNSVLLVSFPLPKSKYHSVMNAI